LAYGNARPDGKRTGQRRPPDGQHTAAGQGPRPGGGRQPGEGRFRSGSRSRPPPDLDPQPLEGVRHGCLVLLGRLFILSGEDADLLRADLFPPSRFRMAYDRLAQRQPARAAKEYLRIRHLVARAGEAGVEAALAGRLDARLSPLHIRVAGNPKMTLE
jgi:hypothetical protein